VKQLLFMAVVTGIAVVGSFASTPFVGFCVYVLYGVLRPQFMWKWSLETYGAVNWSLYVALATIVATVLFGPRPPAPAPGRLPPSRVRVAPVHVAMLLFGLTLVASYFTARVPEAGDRMVDDYWKMFLMFAVGAVVTRTVGQVWALYLTYALTLAYIAYEVNYLYLVNGYLGIARNGYGGHDNNGAGMLLAMGVPLCAFAWESTTRWYRWAFALFIPVILHAVLMTYSRGAMLALGVAAPFWILRGRYRKQKIALGVAAMLSLPILAGQEIRDRFFSVQKFQDDGSANSRFVSWRIGWEIAIENPVFGVGIRNSPLLTFGRGADLEGRVIHSQYIQIAADNGFVGLACYLAVVGFAMWDLEKVIRAARRRDDPDSVKAYLAAAGFQGAIVTFLVGAVFLSAEAFEPQYWMFLAAAQLRLAYFAAPYPAPAQQRLVPA
jgi:probable O-glycosylation ligase (exosortase A-associated)